MAKKREGRGGTATQARPEPEVVSNAGIATTARRGATGVPTLAQETAHVDQTSRNNPA